MSCRVYKFAPALSAFRDRVPSVWMLHQADLQVGAQGVASAFLCSDQHDDQEDEGLSALLDRT